MLLRIKILLKLLLILVIFSIPTVLFGFLLFGNYGAVGGLILPLTWLLLTALSAEYRLARTLRANAEVPAGLSHSLEWVANRRGGNEKLPQILVYCDPSPNLLITRSLGRNGTIFLSQGLIAYLNEEELRATLKLSLSRIKQSGIVFHSFCLVLAFGLLKISPGSWVNLVEGERVLTPKQEQYLTPISALGFLVMFPFVRFFLKLGHLEGPQQKSPHLGGPFAAAMQKLDRSGACFLAGTAVNPTSTWLRHIIFQKLT
jgi:hypothetical protein